ncbi:hypothetical protein PMIN04_000646 [Paraphaeosphaeria minitans]
MPTNDFPSRVLPALAVLAAAASLKDGFCGHNNILISRLPLPQASPSSWGLLTLVRLFHEHDAQVTVRGDTLVSSKKSWADLETGPRYSRVLGTVPNLRSFSSDAQPRKLRSADGSYDVYDTARGHGTHAVRINRATLINILVLSNARAIYEYSDASGYRGAFGSWTGQRYIDWRAGQPAVVTLRPHDSHAPTTDVYPPAFPARVGRCVRMMAGVVVDAASPESFGAAFPGRLAPDRYRLKHRRNGFGLSHGSRHTYNMNGGKVFEIDFLFPEPVLEMDAQGAGGWRAPRSSICLALPSLSGDDGVEVDVSWQDEKTLSKALDRLPWTNLSWSMHRGMRDLLLAVAHESMEQHRDTLARSLRDAAQTYHAQLVCSGWDGDFAKKRMGEMAAIPATRCES